MANTNIALSAVLISFIFYISPNTIYSSPAVNSHDVISKNDSEYLKSLAKDTFSCLIHFTNKGTGLPYDVSDYRKATSISNIGLYLASVAAANKVGIIGRKDAISSIRKVFDSLEKIEKWHGFPVTWVDIETLKTTYGTSFSYADHIGNLVCGLLVVRGEFQNEFGRRIDKFIGSMDFAATYDDKTGWLKGGYDVVQQDFQIKQSWGKWYYNLYASDTRHFSLLAILLGKIPQSHWNKLIRDKSSSGKFDKEMIKAIKNSKPEARYCSYYAPGLEGGGLFMQYLPGLFLDENQLPLRESAKNLARCQIEYSKIRGQYPFWGYSASESWDGSTYLGWSSLEENTITPHACALAIEDYPIESLEALRAIEKTGGRPEYIDKDTSAVHHFGFTDSYNTEYSRASSHYLSLDQSMLFLSLANYLYDNSVRKSFGASKHGAQVNKLLHKLEAK